MGSVPSVPGLILLTAVGFPLLVAFSLPSLPVGAHFLGEVMQDIFSSHPSPGMNEAPSLLTTCPNLIAIWHRYSDRCEDLVRYIIVSVSFFSRHDRISPGFVV